MRLYPETETQFDTNGIGVLADAVSCIVTEERNGAFELELQYPVAGLHFQDIQTRCVILAAPNPMDDEQPFRIYKISKALGGIVTINAEHISYDLSGIPLSPFTASNAADAMAKLPAQAAAPCAFTFYTDKSTAATLSVRTPKSIRAVMGGHEGSLLDVYGGEYRYDRYRVSLLNARGQDNGVSIRYGKNLTDLTQEENIAGVYTGAYPYWASQEDYFELPEKLVSTEGTFSFTRILPLDLSSEFQEKPTAEQLRARAKSYLKDNRVGVPMVSIQVSFVPLEQTEEYKHLALLERVALCDTVNVQFDALGVDATAKCVKTVYDVLKQRYVSVELGDARTNIADTLAEQKQAIAKAPTFTAMQSAIGAATKLITGNSGGYVVLHSSTGASAPDEILIMDTPDIATAKKVWRWNNAGLGYSSKGYNGPYGLAMTQDGEFVADFITVGTLTANLIKAGVLSSLNGKTTINMDTGSVVMNGGLDCDSLVVRGAAVNGSMVMMLKAIQMPDGTYLPQMSFFGADKKQAGAITIGADYTIMSLGRDGTGGDLSMSTSADGSSHMSFRENRSDGMPGNGISIGVNRLGIPELQLRGNGSMKRYLELEWEYDSTRAKYILTGSVGAT